MGLQLLTNNDGMETSVFYLLKQIQCRRGKNIVSFLMEQPKLQEREGRSGCLVVVLGKSEGKRV